MAHRKYLLTYPNGKREHIDRETRDSLLLSQSAKQTGPNRYRYTAPVRTFHSFKELENLYVPQHPSALRRFLAGCFIFEHKGKRKRERMETADGMALRYAVGGFDCQHS